MIFSRKRLSGKNLSKNRLLAIKVKSLILCAVLCTALFAFTGCSRNVQNNGKMNIVCTTYPQYNWIQNIIGEESDKFNLTLLVDGGVDLHSYQPSAKDMAKISSADVFVYVGGSSDAWVLDAVRETVNKNMKKVNMMELLGDRTKEEEVVEGMQEDEHGHSHTASEDSHLEHSDPDDIEYDEHIWLSVKNAEVLTQKIADVIKELDSDNADEYQSNADTYIKQLSDLDKEYETVISSSRLKTVVFGDRFPFRYLVDDYNLDYYAAFAGCSAETEASFKTVTFLASKVDEIGTRVILTIDGSDERLANTRKDNTQDKNQEILKMDSMQSVKTSELEDYNYINIMLKNLTVLKQALS